MTRLLLLVSLIAVGCYSSNIEERSLLCGGDRGDCPSPLVCGCDGRCHATAVDKVVDIDGGANFACALRESGTVVCVGKNDLGELGDGTTTSRATPAPVVGLHSIVALSVGYTHACALDEAGTVRCWGGNEYGKLGDGSDAHQPVPVVVPLAARAVEVAAGFYHTCARLETDELVCWGRNVELELGVDATITGSATPIAGPSIPGIVELRAGGFHTCARTYDNNLVCWGRNSSGQLGHGVTSPAAAPAPVISLDGTILSVSVGAYHTCALTTNGDAYCWGYNGASQLGDGGVTDQPTPKKVLTSETAGFAEISAGTYHTCIRRPDGTAACVGGNTLAQLGDTTTEERNFVVPVVELGEVSGITASINFTCAWRSDGVALCWGSNLWGQLGIGVSTLRAVPQVVSGLQDVTQLGLGYRHSCARTSNALYCWGNNTYGQLGDNTETERHAAAIVPSFGSVSAIDGGSLHTCAVRTETWCWGRNQTGQVGDNTVADRPRPTRALPASGGYLLGATQVVAGASHSCALVDESGTKKVYCWGRNNERQLGNDPGSPGVGVSVLRPIEVPGLTGVEQLMAGGYYTCVLQREPPNTFLTAKCWGRNVDGELGNAAGGYQHAPTTVPLPSAPVQLSTGYTHACATTDTGEVYCWGLNINAELGQDLSLAKATMPMKVPGLTDVVEVRAATYSTCARRTDNSVWCWGGNGYGQLGDGDVATILRPTPRPIPGLQAVELAGKYLHFCARLPDSSMSCWGFNANGQLGDGTTSGQLLPAVSQLSCPGSG